MSRAIQRSLSMILTVILMFTSVVPAMADSDAAVSNDIGDYSDTAENLEANDVIFENEEEYAESMAEQQPEDERSDVSGVSDGSEPDNSDGLDGSEPGNSDGVPDGSDMEEPSNANGEIDVPGVEEPIEQVQAVDIPAVEAVAYDAQPETPEDVQAAVDNYIAAEYDAGAKPHWEYEVDASLMPEGWECVSVTGDEAFDADYYTIAEIVQAGEIVITSGEIIYFTGDRGEVDFLKGITAVDADGADISENLEVEDDGGFDRSTAGTYDIQYVIREGEDVIANHTRTASVIQTDITIHAEDAVIYASDYLKSNGKTCEDCGDAHVSTDAETLRLMAMLNDVYAWDANNCGVGGVQVIDDGGFTLDEIGGGEVSFTVKYAVSDDDGTILAKTERVIMVRRYKVSFMSAVGRSFGGDAVDGSIEFVIDDTGWVRSLYKRINGEYDSDYFYCVKPQFAWWIGNVQYTSPYVSNGDWMNSTLGNRLGSADSIEYSDDWFDAYDPAIVQTQTAVLTWTKAWGNGTIDLVWTVNYVRGAGSFTHEWKVVNRTGAPITDEINLYYGGHHRLGGGTLFGWSYFDAVSNCIYTWKDTNLGMYIFRSDGAVEPASYHAMTNVNKDIAGWVRDKTAFYGIPGGAAYYRSDGKQFHTTYYMQWKSSGSLANGGAWKVEATEGCINPGDISILEPSAKTVTSGVTVSYSFVVMNMAAGATTVDLSAAMNAAAAGWDAQIIGSTQITLDGLSDKKTVTVNVTVPDNAVSGSIGTVTLTGNTGSFTTSAFVNTTVDEKVAAITDVLVDRLTSDELDVKVKYSNLSGQNLTKVEVYSLDGTTMYSSGSASIATGGVVKNIDVSMLTNGTTYRLKAYVDGIEYPYNQTTFTYYKNVTVSFESNGGTAIPSQVLTSGSLVKRPSDPVKTGHTFAGWYKEASTKNEWSFAADTAGASNFTLYAKWTAGGQSVTYKANGGTGSDYTDAVVYDQSYAILSNKAASISALYSWQALKEWNTKADGTGTGYSVGQKVKIDKDLTLYAIWTWDEATFGSVTYDANGGNGGYTESSIKPDEKHIVLSAAAVGISSSTKGFVFYSWNTAANGSGDSYYAGNSITVGDDITLYAQWEHNGTTWLSVTYDANGGVGRKTDSNLLPGASYSVLTEAEAGVSRLRYNLSSWNTKANGTGLSYVPGSSITLTGNLKLYAQWSRTGGPADVTYDANGGNGGTIVSVATGSSHTVLSAAGAGVSKYGYILNSWNTKADGNGDGYAVGLRMTPDNNVTLYAQWEYDGKTKVSVTYDANGGIGGRALTEIRPYTDHTVLNDADATVSRLGHAFKGWSTGSTGSVEYAQGSTLRVTGDITLYAVWEYDGTTKVNVIYDANEGTGGAAVQEIPGASHTVLGSSIVSRTGYALQGWSISPMGSEDYAIGEVIKVDDTITFYAVWVYDNDQTAAITYEGNNLIDPNSYVVTEPYGSTHTVWSIAATGLEVISGMEFRGWNTMADGSGTDYSQREMISVTGDITLFAQWEHDGTTWSKVYYRANGGRPDYTGADLMPGSMHTVLTGAQVGVSRDNYNFTEWNTAADGSGTIYAGGESILIKGNLFLYAIWDVDGNAEVKVTYDANGGSGGKTVNAQAGAAYTVLSGAGADVMRYGYILQSWNTKANGRGTVYAPGTGTIALGGSDITLYARWEYDGSTNAVVTYDANKGIGGTTISVTPGAVHTVLGPKTARVSRMGHEFKGWSTKAYGTNAEYPTGSTLQVNDNITLYAVWVYDETTSVNVVYDASRGVGGTTVTGVIPGENHTVLSADAADVTRLGHTLKGWSTNAAAVTTEYAVGASIKVDHTTTLYAVWGYDTVTTVKVIYDANEGTGGTTVTGITPGDDHTVLSGSAAGVTRAGYVLLGWSTGAGGSVEYTQDSILRMNDTVTLYAVWDYDSSLSATITYNSNLEMDIYEYFVTAAYGEEHSVLGFDGTGLPSIYGLVFTGWSTHANGGGTNYAVGDSMIIGGDITLYAQWEHDGHTWYRVNYDSNGGNGSYSSINLKPGSVYTVLNPVLIGISRNGSDFYGWNTAANGSGTSYAVGDRLVMKGNVALYAQYTGGIVYTVTYDSNDIRKLVDTRQKITVGSAENVLKETEIGMGSYLTGILFDGWNTKKDGSGTSYEVGSYIMPDGDMTLYAQWRHDQINWGTIAYKNNGGTGEYSDKSLLPGTEYTIKSAAQTKIKKIGKTLKGWNTKSDGSGIDYAIGAVIPVNGVTVTLYAQW